MTSRPKNRYEIYDDFCIGYTTNTNKPFYFDKEHLTALQQYEWIERKNGKVVTPTEKKHRALSLASIVYPRISGYIINFKNRSENDIRSANILIESVRE